MGLFHTFWTHQENIKIIFFAFFLKAVDLNVFSLGGTLSTKKIRSKTFELKVAVTVFTVISQFCYKNRESYTEKSFDGAPVENPCLKGSLTKRHAIFGICTR